MTLPPSGEVARVASTREKVAVIAACRPCRDGEDCTGAECRGPGVPLFDTRLGEVTGLPAPVVGTILVVSGMVAQAARRDDVLSPGALVRNDQGRPIGCEGLTCWPK